jgi:hypothetical protein
MKKSAGELSDSDSLIDASAIEIISAESRIYAPSDIDIGPVGKWVCARLQRGFGVVL